MIRTALRLARAAALALPLGACQMVASMVVEPGQNTVSGDTEAMMAQVPATHRALHRSLFVADLHADSLLWDRDLVRRSSAGHMDLPRMAEGNVGLQVFTIVTDTPSETPRPDGGHCVLASSRDLTGLLTWLELRPVAAWFSLRARALDQAEALHRTAARSRAAVAEGTAPELMVVKSLGDLRLLMARLARGEAVVGGLLGVEGAHWVGERGQDEASVRRDVRELFDAGVRVFAPTHRFDNVLGGASEGCSGRGLTQAGRWALEEAERLGMVIDLAHASSASVRDALGLLRAPVVVSHTGLQHGCVAPCYSERNLSDEEVRAVARNGGLIGVGYWPEAVGPHGIPDILRTMAQVKATLRGLPGVVPEEHVALGSDFDGAVETPFDVRGLPVLTQAMRSGPPPMDEAALRAIAGRNACRVIALRFGGGDVAAARALCDGAARGG